jgi:hypothetical protein
LASQALRQAQHRHGLRSSPPAKVGQYQTAIAQPQWLQHTHSRHAVQQAVGQQDGQPAGTVATSW